MDFTVKAEKRKCTRSGIYYIAKITYKGISLNITYICATNNLIIHEWYKLSKEDLKRLTLKW